MMTDLAALGAMFAEARPMMPMKDLEPDRVNSRVPDLSRDV